MALYTHNAHSSSEYRKTWTQHYVMDYKSVAHSVRDADASCHLQHDDNRPENTKSSPSYSSSIHAFIVSCSPLFIFPLTSLATWISSKAWFR